MQSLIAFLRVAHICVTAFMVLIAGSPYISCRCPDGHRKLFCFSSSAQPNGCCSASPETKSCCQGHTERGDTSSGNSCRMGASGCKKILTPPTLVAVSGSDETAPNGVLVDPFVAVSAFDLTLLNPGAVCAAWTRWDHRSPPPADLVVTLRHLLV